MLEKQSYLCSNSAHPRRNQVSNARSCMDQTVDAQAGSQVGDFESSHLEELEGWGDLEVQSAAPFQFLCWQIFVHSVADRGIHQSGYSISYPLCRHREQWHTHQYLLKKGRWSIRLWAAGVFWNVGGVCEGKKVWSNFEMFNWRLQWLLLPMCVKSFILGHIAPHLLQV